MRYGPSLATVGISAKGTNRTCNEGPERQAWQDREECERRLLLLETAVVANQLLQLLALRTRSFTSYCVPAVRPVNVKRRGNGNGPAFLARLC